MKEQIKLTLTEDCFAEHAEEIGKILQKGVRQALLIHKRLGNPIAVWQDGQVVIIPPEEIVLSSEFSDGEE
jgi:hypothetical protein